MTEVDQSNPLLAQPELWAASFLDEAAEEMPGNDDDREEEYDELEAEYDLGEGYEFRVGAGSYGAALSLVHPDAERPVELGWDDLACWHPHALRWSEVDLICRAAALADPDAPYPGPHLIMLGRFAPICTDDDARIAIPLLREAFDAVPGLDAYQRRAYSSHADIRPWGADWFRDDETGWWYPDYVEPADNPYRGDPNYLDGELYSMRYPDNDEFPFAALDAALDLARSYCASMLEEPWSTRPEVEAAAETFAADPTAAHRAALHTALHTAGCDADSVLEALDPDAGELRALIMTELLLGLEPHTLPHNRSGDAPPPPQRFHAHVSLPVASAEAPREGPASDLKPHLNAALRAAGVGSTKNGPARLGRSDGTWVDDLPLIVIDDWRRAVEVIREVLRTAEIPAGSSIEVTHDGETEVFPLDG
ncbi:hypothetical protein GPX89_16450 [Nocardia sp. ET3-3]|uniref:Uncharacterized protein n=1 Tax=Nocardia terrae TaxID=2675851 RepID=A0A7K1UWT0_9NOCA|nr:hypothetical protein [Nocardia terrae]MVU78830.1 hypothetical protein [Nocardia terrae]